MSKIDLNIAPYYDDYDSTKQYTQLLAIPGRVAQAREITQLQTNLKDMIRSIGNEVFEEGTVIDGCDYFIDKEEKTITIYEGKVYMSGMILPVKETKLNIDLSETETIGFKLRETIIATDGEYAIVDGVKTKINNEGDNTLRDPALGYENHNQPGCDRLKSVIEVVRNDSTAAPFLILKYGERDVKKVEVGTDAMNIALAERTYDESGSYVVSGLNVTAKTNIANDTEFIITVAPGKAYVKGYAYQLMNSRNIIMKKENTSGPITKSNRYNSSTESYYIDKSSYIKAISNVTGSLQRRETKLVESSTETVPSYQLKGLPGSISSIVSLSIDDVIVPPSNYSIEVIPQTGTTITWKEDPPAIGTSVIVIYIMEYEFRSGTHYDIVEIGNDSHIIWRKSIAELPVENTNFYVTYEQYFARKDIVYITKDGEISTKSGIPAYKGYESYPTISEDNILLAYISSTPGLHSNAITVNNVNQYRFTMKDIRRLEERIRTLEYDQATLSLNDDARNYNTDSPKLGIWTEPFIDYSRLDYYYNTLNGVTLDKRFPSYNAVINFNDNICYLPVVEREFKCDYNIESSTVNSYSHIYSLKKKDTQRVVVEQDKATRDFRVNPYTRFDQAPIIYTSPDTDPFIEQEYIYTSSSVDGGDEYLEPETRHVEYNNTRGSRRPDTVVTGDPVDTVIRSESNALDPVSTIISETAQSYVRRQIVKIEGKEFAPNATNLRCTFDGVTVTLYPVDSITINEDGEPEVADGVSTISTTNSNGEFSAEFYIPANIPTGEKEIVVEVDTERAGYLKKATCVYIASSTLQKVNVHTTNVVTEIRQMITTVTTTHYIDPVGQIFVLPEDTLLSGVDLFFSRIPDDPTNEGEYKPVQVEIRGVANGTITSERIGGPVYLSPNQINFNKDDTEEQSVARATRFNFEDPVYLESNKEYALVVKSVSSSYNLWVATLGEIDKTTKESVLSNPYLVGLMMSSSNNASWTAHQTTDLKFRLVADEYEAESDIYFDEVTLDEGFCKVYLHAEDLSLEGTSIDWEYRLDGTGNWSRISPKYMEFLENTRNAAGGYDLYKSIQIRAKMRQTTTSTLTPLLRKDSIGLTLSKYESTSAYAWRLSTSDDYNEDNIYYTESAIPDVGDTLYQGDKTLTITSIDSNGILSATSDDVTTTYERVKHMDIGGGYYISKNIVNLDNYKQVDVILDTYPKTDTSIEVFIADSANPDNLIQVGKVDESNPLIYSPNETKVLNYGWVENIYRVTLPEKDSITDPRDFCKVFVKLSSDTEYKTPVFKRLRMIIS